MKDQILPPQITAAFDSYIAGVFTAVMTVILSEALNIIGMLFGLILSTVLIIRGINGNRKEKIEIEIRKLELKKLQDEKLEDKVD